MELNPETELKALRTSSTSAGEVEVVFVVQVELTALMIETRMRRRRVRR